MRRDSVLTWLVEQGSRGAGEQGSILAEGILWFPATTLEVISEEIGVNEKTVRRDIKELEGRGIIVNKRRFRGVQLGLVVGEVNGQNVHLQPDSKRTKCPLTPPLYNKNKSLALREERRVLEKKGDVGGRKTKRMVWEDLVVLASDPSGWDLLEEGVNKYGFAKCVEERLKQQGCRDMDHAKVMGVVKFLRSRRIRYPQTAIVKALYGWTRQDNLFFKAQRIAEEEMRGKREAWESTQVDPRVASLIAGVGVKKL